MVSFTKRSSRTLFLAFSIAFIVSFNPVKSRAQSTQINGYFIFFDLGDVLLKTSTGRSFAKNFSAIARYLFKHGAPDRKEIKSRLFELMDHQTGRERGSATNNGEQVPGIMCDWLEGKIDSYDFVAIVTNIATSDPFFKSNAEGHLLIGITKLMLPQNMVDIHYTTKLLKTFQRCCQQNPNRVCILSNWDKTSIEKLKNKFPEIFNLIPEKNVVFSGECGLKKPDHAIYKLAAQQVGARPEQCILVDDQPDNIDAAYAFGWNGILHHDIAKTSQALKISYGIA